jgi:hypothetical protein
MQTLSAVFYFLSHHSGWSFPLIILFWAGIGVGLTAWRGNAAWMGLGIFGFIAAMFNIFMGSMANGVFLNAYGTYGSAVITHQEETNSTLNEQYIWAYDAVMTTADGRDFKTDFDTMSAALYPWRNAIQIPPMGERFVVKYIPGFERNIVIMRDESPYGKRNLFNNARAPVEKAARQLAASPNNPEFKNEYRAALRDFLAQYGDRSGDADGVNQQVIEQYRRALAEVEYHEG